MSVIEAYRAVAGLAACIIELLTCVSEFTSENSVTSPARTHAANGKRVFTGRVPTILNMAILPRCACVPALPLKCPYKLKTLVNRAWFQSDDLWRGADRSRRPNLLCRVS